MVRLRKQDRRAMLGFEERGDDEQNTSQWGALLSAPIGG